MFKGKTLFPKRKQNIPIENSTSDLSITLQVSAIPVEVVRILFESILERNL